MEELRYLDLADKKILPIPGIATPMQAGHKTGLDLARFLALFQKGNKPSKAETDAALRSDTANAPTFAVLSDTTDVHLVPCPEALDQPTAVCGDAGYMEPKGTIGAANPNATSVIMLDQPLKRNRRRSSRYSKAGIRRPSVTVLPIMEQAAAKYDLTAVGMASVGREVLLCGALCCPDIPIPVASTSYWAPDVTFTDTAVICKRSNKEMCKIWKWGNYRCIGVQPNDIDLSTTSLDDWPEFKTLMTQGLKYVYPKQPARIPDHAVGW